MLAGFVSWIGGDASAGKASARVDMSSIRKKDDEGLRNRNIVPIVVILWLILGRVQGEVSV